MPAPAYLLVKGKAGLGNRILSLLTGVLYARLTGRTIVVDWRDPIYSSGNRNVFHDLFHAPGILASLPPGESRGVAPAFWQGNLDRTVDETLRACGLVDSPLRQKRTAVDVARLDYVEQIAVFWALIERIQPMRRHFHGRFLHYRSSTNEEILRDLLRELPPGEVVAERLARFRRQHWDDAVVGVHLRSSDRQSRTRPILAAVDRVLDAASGARLFVATDNQDVLRRFRNRYGASRVISTEKWYPASGAPMHRDPGCPDRLENARMALLDMHLLAAAGWLITDQRSSFAYLARLLFPGPASRVSNADPAGFLPRHWAHEIGGLYIACKGAWKRADRR